MPLVKLGLSSGREISASKIMLFSDGYLSQANSMKAEAIKKLGGVHSGVGLLGSPAWAIGGGMVIGALEAMATKTLQKEGVKILKKVEAMMRRVKDSGTLVDVDKIKNIYVPNPQRWSTSFIKTLTGLDKKTDKELRALCDENDILFSDIIDVGFIKDKVKPEIDIETRFVFDGDDFVCVLEGSEKKHVRWSDVSTYRIC